MEWINDWLVRFSFALRMETGAVATEYGLILMLVALVIILAVGAFGVAVSGLIDRGANGVPAP
jgi:Flp pilus assembly pilin Flp